MTTLDELHARYHTCVNGKVQKTFNCDKRRRGITERLELLIHTSKGIVPRGPAYKSLMRREARPRLRPYHRALADAIDRQGEVRVCLVPRGLGGPLLMETEK